MKLVTKSDDIVGKIETVSTLPDILVASITDDNPCSHFSCIAAAMAAAEEPKMDQLSLDESAATGDKNEEEVVDPWTVKAATDKGIDYDKLISEWHSQDVPLNIRFKGTFLLLRTVRQQQGGRGPDRPTGEGDGQAGAPLVEKGHLLLPPRPAPHPQRRGEGQALLPLHGARALLLGHAHRPPPALSLHQVSIRR